MARGKRGRQRKRHKHRQAVQAQSARQDQPADQLACPTSPPSPGCGELTPRRSSLSVARNIVVGLVRGNSVANSDGTSTPRSVNVLHTADHDSLLLLGLTGPDLATATQAVRAAQQAKTGQGLTQLRRLAVTHGLVSSTIRAATWPLLLGLGDASAGGAPINAAYSPDAGPGDSVAAHEAEQYEAWQAAPHRDRAVVTVDVARSLWAFTKGMSDEERGAKRQQLERLLNAVVACHEGSVHYYQGLHDIAGVLLLVLGSEAAAFRLLRHLVTQHLRDATRPSLDAVVQLLGLMQPLVDAVDPGLGRWLQRHELQPFFALSWFITWWAHDMDSLDAAARLFDVFLASHPLMPLYVGAVAMHSQRAALLACGEMPELHSALVNLRPDRTLSLDQLLRKADALLRAKPPEALVRSIGGPLAWLQPDLYHGARARARSGSGGGGQVLRYRGPGGRQPAAAQQQALLEDLPLKCVAHSARLEGRQWHVPAQPSLEWFATAAAWDVGSSPAALVRVVAARLGAAEGGKRKALISTALSVGVFVTVYAAVAVAGYAARFQEVVSGRGRGGSMWGGIA